MINNGLIYYKRIKDIIPEVKDYYYITSTGEIVSNSLRIDQEQSLYFSKDNNGRLLVRLSTETGKRKSFAVHKLVALAFVYNDNPVEKTQVIFKDRNKSNINAWNLEWVGYSEKIQHEYQVEIKNKRTQVFTTEQIHMICRMFENGITDYKVILENLGHDLKKLEGGGRKRFRQTILKIRKREIYTEISSQYNF